MLAGVAGTNLWDMLAEERLFDRDRYVAALAALPESWEKDRPRIGSSQRSRSPRARVKKRGKKGGGGRRRR
jgi:hypothetical protein